MTFMVRKFTTTGSSDEVLSYRELITRFPFVAGFVNPLTQSFYLKLIVNNERLDIEKI